MARDAVTITPAAANAATATPAGTTVVVANGAVLNGVGASDRILVRVTHTDGAAHDVTFKAGDNPPASRQGLGDLTAEVAATTGDSLFVLESARFMQNDGTILVDFETGFVGKISAVRLPKGA